jgi:hypothetical protein
MRHHIRVFVFTLVVVLSAINSSLVTAAERTFPADVVRQDFAELYQRLQASHYDLYARRSRPEYDALFKAMMERFTRPMTEFETRIAFQKFAAFGRVAHANIAFPSDAYGAFRDAGGRSLPMLVRVIRGRVFVQLNNSGVGGVNPGDEILSLNGEAMPDVLKRLSAHVSADNDYMMGTLLENRMPPLLWAEYGALDQFDLDLGRNGRVTKVRVPARTRAEVMAAMQGQSAMLDLDWDKRDFRVMPNGVGYLRPGPFYNNEPNAVNMWDTAPFRSFIDKAFSAFLAARVRSVVIDIRDNPGGDNSFSDLMVSWYASKPYRFASDFRIRMSPAAVETNAKRVALAPNDREAISYKLAAAYAHHRMGDVFSFDIPEAFPRAGERFTGRVYLLQNRHSYSNTVQVAALSQDYGFARILGEETSDLATTMGAMEQFTLPRTGIEVGFPKALIIRANGNLAPRGVVPDIAIETPVIEPASDPVLAQALQIAASGS